MLKAGTILKNKYLIEKQLHHGGTSIIYKAYHNSLKINIAIKKLDKNFEINYRHEVDILKKLNHSMLPRVYDVFKYGEESYIVLDFIEGSSLAQLYNKQVMPIPLATKLISELTNVLSYIHSSNIVHGDIKPGNIMVSSNGELKLVDFGISTTVKSSALGRTRGFSSPEQLSKSTIDNRSDIYSLGATIYYLITGREANKKAINQALSNTPRAFSYIIKKCLHESPNKRYQKTKELKIDLEKITNNTSLIKRLNKKSIIAVCGILVGLSLLLSISFKYQKQVANYQLKVQIGIEYEELNDIKNALKSYNEAMAINKHKATAYYLIANNMYRQQKYEECCTYIENILTENINKTTEYASLIGLLADSYVKQNKIVQALNNYRVALKYEKNDINLYYKLAVMASKSNRYKEANKALQKALDLNPETGYTYLLLGELAMLESDYQEAQKSFQESLNNINNSELRLRAYIQLAEIYSMNSNTIDKAIEILNKAKEDIEFNSYIILNYLAKCYYRKAITVQNSDYLLKAAECYEQLIFINTFEFHVYDNLCVLYTQIGEYTKAKQIIRDMKLQFNNDYRINKRWCFLEIARLNSIHEKQDYSTLLEVYQQLIIEYQNQKPMTEDIEMNLLELKILELTAN